jgi:YHS domain-containing protein
MTVTVTDDAPRASKDGKQYFFCSDLCREKFLKATALRRPNASP